MELGLILQALGHHSSHVIELGRRGIGDGDHVRSLREFDADWFLTSDQFREQHVWTDVYTTLAAGAGRVVRLRPRKRATQVPGGLVAYLARYLVDAYDEWAPSLQVEEIALIDLGRGRRVGSSGPTSFRVYTRSEVGQILQQGLFSGGGPRQRPVTPRRGRSRS